MIRCISVFSIYPEVDEVTVEVGSKWVYSWEEVGLNQTAQSNHPYFNSSYTFGKC